MTKNKTNKARIKLPCFFVYNKYSKIERNEEFRKFIVY